VWCKNVTTENWSSEETSDDGNKNASRQKKILIHGQKGVAKVTALMGVWGRLI